MPSADLLAIAEGLDEACATLRRWVADPDDADDGEEVSAEDLDNAILLSLAASGALDRWRAEHAGQERLPLGEEPAA